MNSDTFTMAQALGMDFIFFKANIPGLTNAYE